MMDYTNVFKDGVLVDVNVRYWSAAKILTPEDLGLKAEDVAEAYKLGKKMLIPSEVIRKFRKIEGTARYVVEKNSFPFPIGNARFVPKKQFGKVLAKLQACQAEYEGLVDKLIAEYDSYREQMIPVYREAAEHAFITSTPTQHTFGPEYDRDLERQHFVNNFLMRIESYYPQAETLRDRFSLSWSVYEIAVPRMRKGKDQIIVDEQSQRDIAEDAYRTQIQQKIGSFLDDVVTTLRAETVQVCTRVVEAIKEGKVIRSTTLDSLRNFVDRFASLNFVGDDTVEAELQKLRSDFLDAYTGEQINESVDLKEELGRRLGELSGVATRITDINSVTGEYHRKIVWKDAA